MPALQRGAAWAEERFLGALRQSVPQNGRVHLHTIGFLSQIFRAPPGYPGVAGWSEFLTQNIGNLLKISAGLALPHPFELSAAPGHEPIPE